MKEGTIYFVQSSENGFVKIGFTTSLEKRMKTLASMPPGLLEVIRAIPGTIGMESAFHKRFSDCRVRGEWFRFDKAMLIATVTETKKKSSHAANRNLFGKIVFDYITSKYGQLRNGSIVLAQSASFEDWIVSPETARSWLSGKRQPCQFSIEILSARHPDLARYLNAAREALTRQLNLQLEGMVA